MPLSDVTSTSIAEALERARLELLRHGQWDELRPAERATRLEMMQRAMASAGVSATLSELIARSSAVDDLTERLVAARAQVAELSARLADAEARYAQATGQAPVVESLPDEVRDDLGPAAGVVPAPRTRGLFRRPAATRH